VTATSAFRFGGRLSLDLTWTLRYRRVAPTEMLTTPDDLRRWVGLAVAPARAPIDTDLLTAAIDLREAVFRAASATIDGSRVQRGDRAVINAWAERPGPTRLLDASGRGVVRLRADDEIGSALAEVADDAIGLLAGAPGRLRRCEGPDCALLFHDGSRPGRRRWCSAERCGNRVNTTAYRRRNSTSTTEV
jgi:predicted RNA-binding Zn ribbon-like protein